MHNIGACEAYLICVYLVIVQSGLRWRLNIWVSDTSQRYKLNILKNKWLLLMASTVYPEIWQEIYFGGLAVLRAICQYFICQNLHNVMSSLLKNHLCTRLAARHASLKMAWSLPLKSAYEDIASPNSFIHRRRRVSWSVNAMKAIQMMCTRSL